MTAALSPTSPTPVCGQLFEDVRIPGFSEKGESLGSVVSTVAQKNLPMPVLAHTQGCTRHIINLTSLSLQETSVITDLVSNILSGCSAGLSIGGGAIIMSVAKDNLKLAYDKFTKAEDSIAKRLTFAELVNQSLYFATGSTLVAHGVAKAVSLAAHYEVFSAPMAKTVAHVFGGPVIGGIFIVRGTLLAGRALYHLNEIDTFKTNFDKSLKDKEKMKDFLEQAKAISQLDKIIGSQAKTTLEQTDLNKINHCLLEEIDKGMYKEEMKQKIMFAIAILMLLIGISAIVFSGGYAFIAILLFMSIAGTHMDALIAFITTSSTLNNFIEACYQKTRAPQFNAMISAII